MGHDQFPAERMEEDVLFTSENAPAILGATVRRKLNKLFPSIGNCSGQEHVRSSLHTMQARLAASIAEECQEQVQFDTDGMIEAKETTPDACARHLLETVPLYHILAGSSFYASTLRGRLVYLEELKFPDIAQWKERAAQMVEGVLDDLLSRKAELRSSRNSRRNKR